MIRSLADHVGVLAPLVALQHHDRQDGTGYPNGLRGSNRLGQKEPGKIHDFGAIAAVADEYDAMTSSRPYRDGWTPAATLAMIRAESESHFNRQAIESLLSAVPPFPIYSEVIVRGGLHDGCRGVVTEHSRADFDRPTIRLLYDAAGHRFDPVEINLRKERDLSIEALPQGQASRQSLPKAA